LQIGDATSVSFVKIRKKRPLALLKFQGSFFMQFFPVSSPIKTPLNAQRLARERAAAIEAEEAKKDAAAARARAAAQASSVLPVQTEPGVKSIEEQE
jgi:hypothetical protein